MCKPKSSVSILLQEKEVSHPFVGLQTKKKLDASDDTNRKCPLKASNIEAQN
jgi:hypothetical protein